MARLRGFGLWQQDALKPSGFEERQHNLYNRERSNFVVVP